MSKTATESAHDIERTQSPSETNATSEASLADPAVATSLDARYGTSQRNGFDRRFAWITSIVLVAAGIAFVLFSGWHKGSEIEFQDIGHTVMSDQLVTVRFDVTAPSNAQVACAIEALSPSKGTVGWKVVKLPVTESRSHTVSTSVITTTKPVTGSVRSCWQFSD